MEPLRIHEVDDEIRHLCEDAERQTGTSASTRTYARSPAVLKALTAFRGALVREGTLDPVLRELVRIKIAGLNACRY
jgi:alkylhydroperoxidase family enzyme